MTSDDLPHQVLREREKEAIKLRLAEDRRDRARDLGLIKGQQDASAAAAAAAAEAAARAAGAVVSTSASPSSSAAAAMEAEGAHDGAGPTAPTTAPTMVPPALRRDDSAADGADPEETAEVRGRPLDRRLIAA